MFTFTQRKNPSEFFDEQPAKSNEQKVISNEQKVTSNDQKVTSKKFHLSRHKRFEWVNTNTIWRTGRKL